MSAPSFIPADLAPGDQRVADADLAGLVFRLVRDPADSAFEVGYRALWDFFGPLLEIEMRDVLVKRLAWNPAHPVGGVSMLYEMVVVTKADGSVAAVRDHTAIVGCERASPCAVVHLSHNWVAPEFRGKGLAGWMRTFPVDTARRALLAAGLPTNSPVTLVAEMEHPTPGFAEGIVRLKAYEKAGFQCVDPVQVPYHQPDFREPHVIDSTGGPRPLPFRLILRRVGLETKTHVTGTELRQTVDLLYRMYATNFRPADMLAVEKTLAEYPAPERFLDLVKPTLGL